jgi:hypothetical protein
LSFGVDKANAALSAEGSSLRARRSMPALLVVRGPLTSKSTQTSYVRIQLAALETSAKFDSVFFG